MIPSGADLSPLSNPYKWMFPVDDTKPTQNWSCEWSVDEDAKLVVGVWKHGHGNWEQMQKDSLLGLEDKFFLDDAKHKDKDKDKEGKDKEKKRQTPSSIHLVRRADYLTHLLREHYESKHGSSSSRSAPAVPSRPAPRPKVSQDSSSKPAGSKSAPAKSHKDKAAARAASSSGGESDYDSMDERECKDDLRPVKRELKRLKLDTSAFAPQEKVAHLKECISAIGSRIELIASQEKSSTGRNRRRKHLCESPHRISGLLKC